MKKTHKLVAGGALFFLGVKLFLFPDKSKGDKTEGVGRAKNVLKEDKGVTVSVNEISGSALGELVGTAEIDATPEAIADAIWDIDSYPQWVPRIKDTDNISKGKTSRVDYFVFEAPGGDRDIVSEMKQSDKGGTLVLSFTQKEGVKYTPAKTGLTRLGLRQGSWTLTPSGSGTSVTYKLRADPGIDMNKRILENLAAKGIIDLFEALRKEV